MPVARHRQSVERLTCNAAATSSVVSRRGSTRLSVMMNTIPFRHNSDYLDSAFHRSYSRARAAAERASAVSAGVSQPVPA